MARIIYVLFVAMLAAPTSACVVAAAAGAGAMAADEFDEAKECGDDFDPLEDVRGKEDDCN